MFNLTSKLFLVAALLALPLVAAQTVGQTDPCDANAFEVDINGDTCGNEATFAIAWNSLWAEMVDEIGSDEDADAWHTSIRSGNANGGNRRLEDSDSYPFLEFDIGSRTLQTTNCAGLETCTASWCCLTCPYCRRRDLRSTSRKLAINNTAACNYINGPEDKGTEHTCLEGATIVCTIL